MIYLPYGEILTNKRSTGSNYNTPYKFSAKEGIDYMERFLQVMEVKKTHITDSAQIAIEKSYNFYLNQSTQSKQDCYTNTLNNAIRVGKQCRNESNN
ncbi:MAG: hypothetical protein GX259_08705 [Bacteroidales bacterium]|nr:hypothetical protein [Bacteroidales bacterium]